MGFLQRLFSRGKSKKQQNGHATDEDGTAPKTRHSLSVINALVDRDRRKAHSSTRPSADGPLDEDPSLTRLLRTNSTNFRVINEIDYKSFPPLAHPINDVVSTAPVSGDENNFKTEVHRRRIHARAEFPRANSPLSHLDSSHSSELPPESTDYHSDTEGQEGRRKLVKPKPNSYSKATSSMKLSTTPKESSSRRLSGIFARPVSGQQEATVSTRSTNAQATNSMSSRAFQSISSMTSHSNTSSWRSTRASPRSPITPAIERLRKDPSVASLLNMWEPDGSLKPSAFSNTPPGEHKREHKLNEPTTSPPVQQVGTPSPSGHDETFNVSGWSLAHTVHDTPSSTRSSLPPPDSEFESYDSTDDMYPNSSLHVEAGSDGDLSFGSDFLPAERNPSPTPSNEDEEFTGSPPPVRRASQVFNFLNKPRSEWQSSAIEEIPSDQHDFADVTATAVDQQEAKTTTLTLPVDPTRRPRGPRANPSPSPLKHTVSLPGSDDEDNGDVGLSPTQRRATQKPPPSRIPRPISRGRSGSDSAHFFATGISGRKSISPLSAMRRPLPQRVSPTAERRPSSGVGWIDPNQPPRPLSRESVASTDDYATRARAVVPHERAPSRVSFVEPERSHSRASMINTGAHPFVPARAPTPEFRAAHVRPASGLHLGSSASLSRASTSAQGRDRAGSGSYQMIKGGRTPNSHPRHMQQPHRRAVSASYGSPSSHRPLTPLLLGVSGPDDYCGPSSRTGRESPLGDVVGRVLLGGDDDSGDEEEDSDDAASVLPYRQHESAEDDGFRRTMDVDMSKLALRGDTMFNSVRIAPATAFAMSHPPDDRASHKVSVKAEPENSLPIDVKRTPTSPWVSTPNGIGSSKTPESLSPLERWSLAYPLGSQPPRSSTPLINMPTGSSSRLKTPNRPSGEENPSPASSSKLGSYGKEIMALARTRSVKQPAR